MGKLKKIGLVLLALILVGVVSAGVSYAVLATNGKEPIKLSLGTSKEEIKEFGPIIDVGEFTVNIEGNSFLKVQVSVELANKKLEEQVKTLLPVVKDKTIGVLSTKTLNDVKSPNGKENLRKELLSKINEAFGTTALKNVLFTSYVYQ